MNTYIHKIMLPVLMLTVMAICSCKKNYYTDTGLHDPNYKGTVLQYLQSNPFYFDTLVQVIKLAGMEETFSKDEITFFAPADPCFFQAIRSLNDYLKVNGRDTVQQLSDIKPAVWKNMLQLYLFKGKKRLRDYTQVDTLALDTYNGQGFLCYNERPQNIGVIFNDAVSGTSVIKYAGYRQLMLSYIPDFSQPRLRWLNVPVASSDIAPYNGIVHVLMFSRHSFGFDPSRFILLATENGVGK
ncbi:fasciclin domain-containing protein [Chitinophaga qingshengii]|uniref:Fasciclin domain-containing protein n=1 Tax=Chitinophaga qingshengii TaxID=1569794 RepID=A0ABR7TQM4_9BACT|nr:fasciclin domain-containing protein [Chitinophaga qingshengii]MBC9932283.1 fasciclin domain-containing protein [Chitinophaga qingshengii]